MYLGTCNNCKTKQYQQKNKKMAKKFLEGSDITPHITDRVNEEILEDIKISDQVSFEDLLSTTKFDATYNKYYVFTEVSYQVNN